MSSGARPASAMARGARLDRERERVAHQPATDLRHARSPRSRPCPRTCRATPSGGRARSVSSSAGSGPGSVSPVGANSGNHTSSCCSNSHRDLHADVHVASGSHPTTLVVSRTRSSSSSATIATTYGGLIVGSHWCAFTVHPTTVPRPETSTTSMSVERQCGQTGSGREQQRATRDAALHPQHTVAARRSRRTRSRA